LAKAREYDFLGFDLLAENGARTIDFH